MLKPCKEETENQSLSTTTSRKTLMTAEDRASRACLVNRFWAENGDRRRHIFFVSWGTDLHDLPTDLQESSNENPNDARLRDDSETTNHISYDADWLRDFCSPFSSSPLDILAHVREVQPIALHKGLRGYARCTRTSSASTLRTGKTTLCTDFSCFGTVSK